MCKCLLDRLRHALDLEREDPEVGHHLRHCSRDHSEVLTACEHSCRIKKCRKLLHCLILPELVVATVEEVVIHAVECCLAICVKPLVALSCLSTDLRMVVTCLARILHEEVEVGNVEAL